MEDEIAPEAESETPQKPEGEAANVTQPDIERITFLKVPIDIVEPDRLTLVLFRLANEQQDRHIVLLSVWDLLRARRNSEYREYVNSAALVIPISKSIVSGARFVLKKRPVRYMPFDFVIKCLTVLEEHEFSCYLLGSTKRVLLKIERNIVSTFPDLRIVGRFQGRFKRHEEVSVVSAIRKASPTLLLVGKGVRGKEFWIARNAGRLGNGVKLWCSDMFDVLAGRKWRPHRKVFEFGLEWVGYCLRNPAKLLRLFPFLYYNHLLLLYKVFKRKNKAAAEPG